LLSVDGAIRDSLGTLRSQLGGMAQHGVAHRFARRARVAGGCAPIQLVNLTLVRRLLAHANSFNKSLSLLRA
jgi:hypothetical protein